MTTILPRTALRRFLSNLLIRKDHMAFGDLEAGITGEFSAKGHTDIADVPNACRVASGPVYFLLRKYAGLAPLMTTTFSFFNSSSTRATSASAGSLPSNEAT